MNEKVLSNAEINAYRACICRDDAKFTEYSLETILMIARRLFATLDDRDNIIRQKDAGLLKYGAHQNVNCNSTFGCQCGLEKALFLKPGGEK